MFSPDGSRLAFSANYNGSTDIYVIPVTGGIPKRVTYRSFADRMVDWHPDGEIKIAANTYWNVGHWQRFSYPISWSPDSKWIAFTIGLENAHGAVFVYDVNDEELHKVSSGYYNDANPVFSADGKYLFYLTMRNFSPCLMYIFPLWMVG